MSNICREILVRNIESFAKKERAEKLDQNYLTLVELTTEDQLFLEKLSQQFTKINKLVLKRLVLLRPEEESQLILHPGFWAIKDPIEQKEIFDLLFKYFESTPSGGCTELSDRLRELSHLKSQYKLEFEEEFKECKRLQQCCIFTDLGQICCQEITEKSRLVDIHNRRLPVESIRYLVAMEVDWYHSSEYPNYPESWELAWAIGVRDTRAATNADLVISTIKKYQQQGPLVSGFDESYVAEKGVKSVKSKSSTETTSPSSGKVQIDSNISIQLDKIEQYLKLIADHFKLDVPQIPTSSQSQPDQIEVELQTITYKLDNPLQEQSGPEYPPYQSSTEVVDEKGRYIGLVYSGNEKGGQGAKVYSHVERRRFIYSEDWRILSLISHELIQKEEGGRG